MKSVFILLLILAQLFNYVQTPLAKALSAKDTTMVLALIKVGESSNQM